MKKLSLIVLTLCLLIACAACQKSDRKTDSTANTFETVPIISADDAGIVSHGWISEEDFPANERLTQWYDEAIRREYVPGSVIYSKDGTDGLWHCWVYLGAWVEGDTVELAATEQNGFCVIINHKATNPESTGCAGAFYFTVSRQDAPSFDLVVNGEQEGLISTHADISVAK